MLSGLASLFKLAERVCRWAVVADTAGWTVWLLGGLTVLAGKSSGSSLGCKTRVQCCFYAVDYFICHGLNLPAHSIVMVVQHCSLSLTRL